MKVLIFEVDTLDCAPASSGFALCRMGADVHYFDPAADSPVLAPFRNSWRGRFVTQRLTLGPRGKRSLALATASATKPTSDGSGSMATRIESTPSRAGSSRPSTTTTMATPRVECSVELFRCSSRVGDVPVCAMFAARWDLAELKRRWPAVARYSPGLRAGPHVVCSLGATRLG